MTHGKHCDKHEHCDHCLHFCHACNATYCCKCGEEWGKQSYSIWWPLYQPYCPSYPTYPTRSPYWYEVTCGGASSNTTSAIYNADVPTTAASCTHSHSA